MVKWYIYIIECRDGTLYTGITVDVEARLKEHNTGAGAKYLRSRRPVKVVYQEKAKDRSEASKREYEIKQLSRKQKLALVAEFEVDAPA